MYMKTNFKKIISILLAVIMMMPLSAAAFAAEADDGSTETAVTEETEILEESVISEDDIVATVSVCSCIYFWPISGHTWIYVHNLSDEPIKVGLYEVPVGQGVSVGAFSFSVYDGWGLYYNLEAYRENRDNNSDDHWTITKELTAGELEDLSNDIANYTNYWDFYFNCAFFAFSIWNSASGDLLVPLVIPAISQFEIIIDGGKKGELEMYYPTADQVYRQRLSGDKAYLEPVSQTTLNN